MTKKFLNAKFDCTISVKAIFLREVKNAIEKKHKYAAT